MENYLVNSCHASIALKRTKLYVRGSQFFAELEDKFKYLTGFDSTRYLELKLGS